MEEILSKSTIGSRRRAGLASLSTVAMVGALCVAGAGAASAATPTGLSADNAPNVTQGATNQAAGDLNYAFVNNYTTGATVTFTLPTYGCDTAAHVAQDIEFASVPTVTVAKDDAAQTSTPPAVTTTLGSSSTQCATAGIQDQVTVHFGAPSTGTATDEFDLKVTNVAYNVGSDTPTGGVVVSSAQTGITVPAVSNTAVNAKVVNTSFVLIPKKSATPNSSANTLGTATFTESTAGAYFPAGATTQVDLALSDGTYTTGVTPNITVPAGYTVCKDALCAATGAPATTGSPTTYSFWVKAPATAVKAVVSVSGLQVDTNSDRVTITVTPTVGASTGDAVPVLNVVKQDRFGGVDRYATAATIFNKSGAQGSSCPPIFCEGGNQAAAVISGGELFPDALSANYLASEVNTGTLLTKHNALSPAARQQLLNRGIDTVFITGGTAAVSQAVQDEIAALHVSGQPLNANIQVIRLGGADRYATNRAINAYQLNGNQPTVIMAAGTAPYDSLAAGPVIYNNGYPLVLTNGQNLNHGEVGQLNDFNAKNVVIVGGTSVVSQAVQDQLTAAGFHVVRIAGANRYETATQIATWASEGLDSTDAVLGSNQNLTDNDTFITNGQGFADALTGGPLAGQWGSPLVLSRDASTVGSALASYLDTKGEYNSCSNGTVTDLNALGLQAATTNAMMREAAADIGYTPCN
jgi:putative cell wall-binding protein